MSRLRIAIIEMDNLKNPFWAAGTARAIREIGKRHSKKHAVTVYCSKYPGYRDYVGEGVRYKHIGIVSTSPKLTNIAFILALPLVVRRIKADVIVESFTAPISTCFVPLFTKIPVVGLPSMFEAGEFSKKYHLPFHIVEQVGCRFYKYFLAFSPQNKRKMGKYNKKVMTRIIPNGVSEEFFSKKTKSKNYALFIGRIDIVQKGLNLLIDAFSLAAKRTDLKLVIAGNGPEAEVEKLKKMIAKNGLASKVQLVGRVDNLTKEDYIANCAFGIYPSRFEDFPLVPLEFASFGKPTVCFDIAGVDWLPDSVAVKAKPFSKDSLQKAIVAVANNSKLRLSLSKNARPFARQYGWNSIARQWEKFFFDVIATHKQKRLAV